MKVMMLMIKVIMIMFDLFCHMHRSHCVSAYLKTCKMIFQAEWP